MLSCRGAASPLYGFLLHHLGGVQSKGAEHAEAGDIHPQLEVEISFLSW